MTFGKIVSVLTCVLMLCVFVPTPTIADQTQYIYDDLGRLSQAIDGQGNVATYQYDAVGNLLSITRNTSVTVFFPRPVDRTGITTATFAVNQGATPVAGRLASSSAIRS